MSPLLRLTAALMAMVACLIGMASAANAGLTRLLAEEALAYNEVSTANEAARLQPYDPEAHYARGLLLSAAGNSREAIESFQNVTELRPHDRSAWLNLGRSYEATGDLTKALGALEEAVRLAPYYAEPRWYLGKCLIKSGRNESGFEQLRIAAKSDATLLPELIDLAWRTYGGSAEKLLEAIAPETDHTRTSLAAFLIEQNRTDEAVKLLRAASRKADYDRYRFMVQLIENHRYREAADVLNTGEATIIAGTINNGDFDQSRLSNESGFGWQVLNEAGRTQITIANDEGYVGSHALRLTFNGVTSDRAEFVKQLVILEPDTQYRLTFNSRSQDLESQGLPTVRVIEAGPAGRLLGESNTSPLVTSDWTFHTIDFETSRKAEAAYVVVQRQRCPNQVCPIFGRIWFDNFSLAKR